MVTSFNTAFKLGYDLHTKFFHLLCGDMHLFPCGYDTALTVQELGKYGTSQAYNWVSGAYALGAETFVVRSKIYGRFT